MIGAPKRKIGSRPKNYSSVGCRELRNTNNLLEQPRVAKRKTKAKHAKSESTKKGYAL